MTVVRPSRNHLSGQSAGAIGAFDINESYITSFYFKVIRCPTSTQFPTLNTILSRDTGSRAKRHFGGSEHSSERGLNNLVR
jgi:hypothetical protein